MTSSPRSVLRGSQKPRVDLTPPFFSTAGDDAVDLARVAGLDLDPWQEHVLRGSLGERRDGRWEAFEVGLVVPRQNGKGSILEARELAGLFLFRERLIIHTAHLFPTANEHRMRLERLIRGTPDLAERVKGYAGDPEGQMTGIKTGNNDMSITISHGDGSDSRVRFLARSGGNSGRGFTGDLVVLDEAYHLPDAVIAAMMPTMAARSMDGSPQIWYTSSAGMPESEVLNRVRARGLSPEAGDRLAYYEWSAEDGDDPDDSETWAKANPALGIRIDPDFIKAERRSMDDEEFKRERLGIWAKVGGSSAIPRDRWDDCLDPESRPSDTVAFGFDVTPLRDAGVIAVASEREDDGRVHIELVDRRATTDWVMPRLAALRDRWNPVGMAFDAGSQSSGVVEQDRLGRRHVSGLASREYMQACSEFFEAVMEGRISHTGQPELTAAVDACRRSKGTSDLWRWARADTTKDISPLVAATLAYYALTSGVRKQEASTGWVVYT